MRVLSIVTLLGLASMAAANPDWVAQQRSPKNSILTFSVSLPESNLDKLDQIFKEVTDPDSPKYGQYKEPEELNRLTATPSHILKEVWNYFEQNGAKCKAFWSHLECGATVEEVEAMFNTEVHDFQHKLSGAVALRINGKFTFPEELQGKVNFISGLTQLPVPRYGRSRKIDVQQYTVVPETLTNVYNIQTSGSSRTSQAAAEFQNYPPFLPSDLKTFISKTGITSFTIGTKIGPFNPGYAGAESDLDVQYLGAVGEGNDNWYWTEQQWMYEFSNQALQKQRSDLPDIISMSYGWSEAQQCQIAPSSEPCSNGGGSEAFVNQVNTNFQKLGATGVTLVAASGDAGAHGRSDAGCSATKCNPAFPASSPYLTAVGATMFSSVTTGGNSPICNEVSCATGGTETVCTSKGGAALITSGGGFSNYASTPDYQTNEVNTYINTQGAVPPSNDYNSGGRGYPDVAALGHAYYIELNGQEAQVDGTSASCPVFAGVIGLLNAYRVENGRSTIGFANPLLYKIAREHPNAFNDITTGNNYCTEGQCCSTGFTATKGWDATTGLGTPNVANLLSALQAIDGLKAPSQKVLNLGKTLRGNF
eukprot:gb/GECG01012651.1/.p1 GENE.gb/GECG01012651.1/~~gb/GECG01012651.1/.p1  ORF type:complete len:592 (+),score=73.71 gb/GECG01012651.1/:1-1776(+)